MPGVKAQSCSQLANAAAWRPADSTGSSKILPLRVLGPSIPADAQKLTLTTPQGHHLKVRVCGLTCAPLDTIRLLICTLSAWGTSTCGMGSPEGPLPACAF